MFRRPRGKRVASFGNHRIPGFTAPGKPAMICPTRMQLRPPTAFGSALCHGFCAIIIATSCLAAEPVFEKDVAPVFRASCVSCHGPGKDKGGFRADSLRSVIESGANGPWVVPGNADASKLLGLVAGKIKTEKAAEKHVLPSAQVEMIRSWINAGAK